MKTFEFSATRIRQGDLEFFTIAMPVKDLLFEGFYNVDKLDSGEEKGYQRILEKARAKKIADYVIANIDNPKGVFIPTSVFMATEGHVSFDHEESKISFSDDLLPFNVVDGQHRLEGFKRAAAEDERVNDLEVAVNICPSMPILHQMCHFYIVNTTQKKVDDSIGQQIISRLTKEHSVGDMPPLPKWMLDLVQKGDTDRALSITRFLNTEETSPWMGKIIMANEPKSEGNTIKQASFHKSVKRHLTTGANPIVHHFRDDFEKQRKAILNYWIAVYEVIQAEDNSVFFKYTGLEIFNRFSITMFEKLINRKDFQKEAIKSELQHVFANMESEHAAIQHSDWWRTGGPASSINAAGYPAIVNALRAALYAREASDDVF